MFAVCAPGLEPFVAAELNKVGLASVVARHGGVSATASWPQVWQLNLWSRCASRVLLRIARFSATSFAELETGFKRIDWLAWLPSEGTVSVSAASTNSALYHTGAIEERAMLSLTSRTELRPVEDFADAPPDSFVSDTDDDGSENRRLKPPLAGSSVLVRIVSDQVTVSIDSSGEPLYKRGWREAVAKAPIRETLAAGLLLASGWDGKSPLVDPFCGSGTVAIEAALSARRIAPGRLRSFAFQTWPTFDETRWARLIGSADADVIDRRPVIVGADRDAGAIAAARANSERADVSELIEWREASISDLVLPTGRIGVIATNPPYGQRIGGNAPAALVRGAAAVGRVGGVAGEAVGRSDGESRIIRSSTRPQPSSAGGDEHSVRGSSADRTPGGRDIEADLRNLYDRWGRVLSDVASKWTVAVVAQPGPLLDRLASRSGTTFEVVTSTSNGGIPVVFAKGTVGAVAAKP